ncbi:MAG: ABC transporter ATP-binding protein [Actinomycetota bacterium]
MDPAARALLRDGFRTARPLQSIGLVAGIAWRGAAIATPLALQRAIDEGVVDEDRGRLALWCGVLVAFGVVTWVGDAIRHRFVDQGAYRAMIATRRRALRALIDADPEHAAGSSPGAVISRVVDDCMRLRTWISGSVTTVIGALTLIVVVALVATLDPVLAIVAIAVVPLASLLAVTQSSANIDAALRSVSSAGETSAWLEAAISGVDTVKGLGAEQVVVDRAAARAATTRRDALGLARIRARWIASASAIPGIGTAVGIWVGGLRAVDGVVTVGELVAFIAWMGLISASTALLTGRLALRGTALAAAHRLARVIDLPPHPAAGPPPPESAPAGGTRAVSSPIATGGVDGVSVRLHEVDVSRGDRLLLSGVSFEARAGEHVALVGPTGSGKSSLLRVLGGDVVPTVGSIEFDGTDLVSISWPARSGLVTLVPQHPTIMTGSIAEVVGRGAPHVDAVAIDALLRDLRLGDLVDDLGGLDGRIGERGRTVSGGQRQRLALAAALLRASPLLLLDDVTSALDEEVERAVLDTIRERVPDATVVFATHREGPAASADRVIDLTPFVVGELSAAGGAP